MMSPVTARKGFNLIEMLILVAIVAVLIGLLVPAVQKVRSASARTRCADNLRHLGLSFLKYHDVNKHFPQGGRNTPGIDPSTDKPYIRAIYREDYSWCYHLLPYIGQAPLHKRSDADVCTTPIALLYCPARRSIRTYHGHAVCDYGGNGGTNNSNGTMLMTGSAKLNLRGIIDGHSSTVLLGERRVNLAFLDTTLDRHDNESCMEPGYDGEVIRWATRSGKAIGVAPDLNDPSLNPGLPHKYFGSSHDTGMNTVFVDGSLRTVSYSIDPVIFRQACVRDDGRNGDF